MNWNKAAQFEQPPSGSFIARCYQIIDIGTQPHINKHTGEKWAQRDVRIAFELPTELMTGKYKEEAKGRPFSCGVTVKQSLHPAAKLTKLLVGWKGAAMDDAAKQAFNPKTLLGKTCRLNLVEAGQYVNIDSISRLGKDDKCPVPINPPVFFSLDENEFDPAVLEALPESTRNKVKASPEYFNLTGAGASEGEGAQADAPTGGDNGEPF
jgi:hypothetical protein